MQASEIKKLCECLRQFGLDGKTQKMVCLELGMSMYQIDELRMAYPEFAHAWQAYRDFCQGSLEALMLSNVMNKGANSQLLGMIMRAEFPNTFETSTYRREKETERSEGEAVDFNSAVTELIASLQNAQEEE